MATWFFGLTDKGNRRENNEDTFIVQEIPGTQLLLACVIDGVGGYSGGEVAAEIARTVILEKSKDISGDIIETLRFAVVAANERIQQQRRSDKMNADMACVLTCVVADKKNNRLWYAHVGDTRLYLLRDENLIKISSDHSAVGFLEESGRLSELDAMQHPRRNEIDRALGFEAAIAEADDYIETGESPFLPGDTILLCSDGLSDMIGSAQITSILHKKIPIGAKAKILIDAANAAGGNDNITAVIVENDRQPRSLQVLKPAPAKTGSKDSPAVDKTAAKHMPLQKSGHRYKLIIFLLIFFTGLMVVAFIQRREVNNHAVPEKQKSFKSEQLAALINAMHDTTKNYTLPANTNLIITGPVSIAKDSFHLSGNGAHLKAEADYKGPALMISNTSKHIVLDSLVFENFDAALFIERNNVVFRNVRFVHCRIPVQYATVFKDTTISGRFKDSIFIHTKTTGK